MWENAFLLHMTAANDSGIGDAPLTGHYAAAKLMPGLTVTEPVSAFGTAVPNVTNTLVVENRVNTAAPYVPGCLEFRSSFPGDISGIGTDVWSFRDSAANAKVDAGTSMSTPQVAGLGAYIWALKPTLTPQEVINIIQTTARTLPDDADCLNAPQPVIDAYAAILAVDDAKALGVNPNSMDAPARLAIFDVVDSIGGVGSNRAFDKHDLTAFVDAFLAANGTARDFSRFDLNGDGYTGGTTRRARFNLDIDPAQVYGGVMQDIRGTTVTYDENLVTDWEVLCYYAFSPLYTGVPAERTAILGPSSCPSGGFEIVEVSPPGVTRPTFVDVGDNGSLLGSVSMLGAIVLTPQSAGSDLDWYVDDNNDFVNDLFTELPTHDRGSGFGTNASGRDINDVGDVVGTADVGTFRGDVVLGTFWSSSYTVAFDVSALVNQILQDQFPTLTFAFLQLPTPRDIRAVNDAGDMMVNVPANFRFPSPASVLVVKNQSTITWLGGVPVAIGFRPDRIAVGMIVYKPGTGADINNSGVVAGTTTDLSGVLQPAKWGAGGGLTVLGVLSGTTSISGGPAAINASEQIVGSLVTNVGVRPVRWDGITPTDLGSLGGPTGRAFDINDQGEIVGWMTNGVGAQRPFIFLPADAYGTSAGLHDFATLVDGTLLLNEYPIRITNSGYVLTSKSRLLRPQ